MDFDKYTRWALSTCGVAILFYALLVLGFVGTSPDVGLRFLLEDSASPDGAHAAGPIIQVVTPGILHKGQEQPQVGDILVAMGPSEQEGVRLDPTSTFLHFTHSLVKLRGDTPNGGKLDAGSDPSELGDRIPPLVEIGADRWIDRKRMVEVEFRRPGKPDTIKTWLLIHSLPYGDILLSFVWFLLELAIFSVGALAFWTRPFDRPARLFFAMCIVTVGAFVGGYHWWVVAGTLWLNIPFSVCAVLVPVVTLHFFLIYPHPKPPLISHPRLTVIALYAIPILAMIWLMILLGYSSWLFHRDGPPEDLLGALALLRRSIYGYLMIAAGYFLATLVALVYSFFTTRNPIEHSQVKWILWAGVFSTIPMGYTLYLAQFHRVEFAIGRGSLPMFIASLMFMLAYAVGILRYKLMLVDQIFSREMLYFVVSLAVTGFYSLTVALSSLAGIYQNMRSSQQAALVVAATLFVGVILLVWLRDTFQRMLDRRFFREKYQLDKALQRMNQTVGHLVEPAVLAERMLSSCRDVLLVDHTALYLRDPLRPIFRLIATEAAGQAPLQLPADQELLDSIVNPPSVQRASPGSREAASKVQQLLRRLNAELIHALEVDGVIAGLVVLGLKRNATAFTAEDLTFLTALGQATSVALHSAKVHEAVARLNAQLQLKVEKINEQQRQIAMLQAEITSTQQLPAASEPEPFRRDLIKGSSPSIRRVLETVRKVSNSQSSVLIRGESGTGKELLAQAIHENSPRRGNPVVRVHCGALAPGVLESELFGHVKGAFTGAHRDKVGRFEMADGGTLFLDEIGDISLETQIKLLRVLQERSFEPVGGSKTIQVDVRLITATHQNLEKLIEAGQFREDLFYRLNVISITLPPLRERQEDIFELALHFLNRSAQRIGKRITHIDEEATEALKRHPWPGNIRELENALERAIVLAEGPSITLHDLPAEILASASGRGGGASRPGESGGGADAGDLSERQQLVHALRECSGNKARAARMLGIPRSTFFSKLKKHAIE